MAKLLILSAAALGFSLGAAQLAGGNLVEQAAATPGTTSAVNRDGKSDRIAASRPLQDRTISVTVPGDARSLLVRVPLVHADQSKQTAPAAPKPAGRAKMAVACEPVVSVLAEVAKVLEPGRCVT